MIHVPPILPSAHYFPSPSETKQNQIVYLEIS